LSTHYYAAPVPLQYTIAAFPAERRHSDGPPWLRRWEVGRGTTHQQVLDHPPPAPAQLWQIVLFAPRLEANRRGELGLVELEASRVNVGAGV
jgi:hypothetical protein